MQDTLRTGLIVALASGSLYFVVPSTAQEAALDGSRFELRETENGLVRLDKKSGQMSLCAITDGNLICRSSADERSAYLSEIQDLEKRIAKLEENAAAPNKNDQTENQTKPKSEARKKFDKELDKTMDFAKDAMRRFFEVIEDLNKDYNLDLDSKLHKDKT